MQMRQLRKLSGMSELSISCNPPDLIENSKLWIRFENEIDVKIWFSEQTEAKSRMSE